MRQGANWRRAAGIGLACAVLCLSLLAWSAQAAVLGWSQNDEPDDVITYEYRGDRGERNQVKVSANTRSGTVLFRDEGAHRLTVTAPGCQRGQGRTVRCRYRELRDLSVETDDRDDRVDIAASASYLFGIASADGGRGNDRVSVRSTTHQLLISLEGGPGNDRLFAGGRVTDNGRGMAGGPGNDRLTKRSPDALELLGESGNDRIDARTGALDNVNCGSGRDRLLADRRDSVTRCERVRRRR